MFVCSFVYMYMFIYHKYTYIYICMYTYIYIYIHTHTLMFQVLQRLGLVDDVDLLAELLRRIASTAKI